MAEDSDETAGGKADNDSSANAVTITMSSGYGSVPVTTGGQVWFTDQDGVDWYKFQGALGTISKKIRFVTSGNVGHAIEVWNETETKIYGQFSVGVTADIQKDGQDPTTMNFLIKVTATGTNAQRCASPYTITISPR